MTSLSCGGLFFSFKAAKNRVSAFFAEGPISVVRENTKFSRFRGRFVFENEVSKQRKEAISLFSLSKHTIFSDSSPIIRKRFPFFC